VSRGESTGYTGTDSRSEKKKRTFPQYTVNLTRVGDTQINSVANIILTHMFSETYLSSNFRRTFDGRQTSQYYYYY